jgi:hypothetical protein
MGGTKDAFLWPDPLQRNLLDAALLPLPQAEAAFRAWSERTARHTLPDQASLRMLPMVYENLRHGVSTSLELRLARRLRLHAGIETQRQRRATVATAALLAGAGIAVMVGKGMALVLGGYVEPGTRPMADIDFYVRYEHAMAAIRCLQKAGWEEAAVFPETLDARIRRTPSLMLRHARHGELDLHWHCLSEISKKRSDERIWSGSRACTIDGVALRLPGANDLLFHIIVHGVYMNELAPLRWVADAVRLARCVPNEIDWTEQARIARAFKLFSRWRLGVDFLARHYGEGLAIPAIAARRPSFVELIENRDAIVDTNHLGRWNRALRGYLAYAVRVADGDHWRDLPGLTFAQAKRKLRSLLLPGAKAEKR